MRQQAERFGATVIDDEVIKVDFKKKPFKVTTHSANFDADVVIIRAGASPRMLEIAVE